MLKDFMKQFAISVFPVYGNMPEHNFIRPRSGPFISKESNEHIAAIYSVYMQTKIVL